MRQAFLAAVEVVEQEKKEDMTDFEQLDKNMTKGGGLGNKAHFLPIESSEETMNMPRNSSGQQWSTSGMTKTPASNRVKGSEIRKKAGKGFDSDAVGISGPVASSIVEQLRNEDAVNIRKIRSGSNIIPCKPIYN